MNSQINKKVLLRERKRHTARRVVNTPSVVLTGYPTHPDLARGVPYLPPRQGTPPAGYPHQGTPHGRVPPGRVPPCWTWQCTPPGWTWQGNPPAGPGRVPPQQGTSGRVLPVRVPPSRVPPHWTWQGTPPRVDLAGYAPPQLDLAGYPPGCPMAFWEMLQSIMGYGYPPRCEQTNKVKILPFRRTTYAGGNYCLYRWIMIHIKSSHSV